MYLGKTLRAACLPRELARYRGLSGGSIIKQHLRIKRFYGTSENAVRTQIWIAISVYVLVAIIKKQLRLDLSLHALLQILSLTLFEKLPLQQAITGVEPIANDSTSHNQLKLFEF